MHDAFIDHLERRLGQPLPGEAAHLRVRVGANYRFTPNEKTRRSAVLVLLYPQAGQWWVPLIQRPTYSGVHSGQVAFPGGGYETVDKTLVRTALREAQEEIGIKASDVRVLGQLTELYIPPSNFLVQPVVGTLGYPPDFYPDPREVAGMLTVSLTELADPRAVGSHQVSARGETFTAPHYALQDNLVWGATAAIISELLEVLASVEL